MPSAHLAPSLNSGWIQARRRCQGPSEGLERDVSVPSCGATWRMWQSPRAVGAVARGRAGERGSLARPAGGSAGERCHAMGSGSGDELKAFPLHFRCLLLACSAGTMQDSTLRRYHGNRSFRLVPSCLHQRPQQGRIRAGNAAPTQASMSQEHRPTRAGRRGGQPGQSSAGGHGGLGPRAIRAPQKQSSSSQGEPARARVAAGSVNARARVAAGSVRPAPGYQPAR